MQKVNGYDVVITKGTPRFRLDNKLIKRELVPIDVQQELLFLAQDKDAVRTVAPAPDASATYTEEQPTSEPVEIDTDGFDENPYVEALASDTAFAIPEPASATTHGFVQPTHATATEALAAASQFSELELQLIEENDKFRRALAVAGEEPVRPVLAGASPEELGNLLIAQYGIYTALSPRDPQIGDIHPFTLKQMNRYDVGLAYAERKKSIGQIVDVYQPVPEPQENKPSDFPTFADRTGVSFKRNQSSSILQTHNNDPINDEVTAEPNLRGTTIRPYW